MQRRRSTPKLRPHAPAARPTRPCSSTRRPMPSALACTRYSPSSRSSRPSSPSSSACARPCKTPSHELPEEVGTRSPFDPKCWLVDLAAVLVETDNLLAGRSPLTRWRAGAFEEIEDAWCTTSDALLGIYVSLGS